MRKNGQVLVAFLLMLPILFLLIGLIVDVGILYTEKRHVNHAVEDALLYGIEHPSEDLEQKLGALLSKNIEEIEYQNVTISEQRIEIEVRKWKKGIFSFLFQTDKYQIVSHYKVVRSDSGYRIERG